MATNVANEYRGEPLQDISIEDDESPNPIKSEFTWESDKQDIDPKYHRFPYCVVWTPLPLISWFLPMIGHVGICTSDGVIHDFAGSNFVSVDDFAFGDPHKYVKLDHDKISAREWNICIQNADDKYNEQGYSFFTNNCHCYVADALNKLKYKGKTNWNMVDVWMLTVAKSRYVNNKYLLRTYIGFIVVFIFWLLFF